MVARISVCSRQRVFFTGRARIVNQLLALAAAMFVLAPIRGHGHSYPTKPIRIVVAATPGGTSDILARQIGQKLTELWKQPVIVENRPGADSNVGADYVAKSQPDGYTLLLMDLSTLTMGQIFYTKLGYDPAKDFAPITRIIFSPLLLATPTSFQVNTVKELIDYRKANPGSLNYASSSNATRLALAQFNLQTGLDMAMIPYKGGSAAMTAIATGEVNVMMNGLLAAMPQLKGGKMKGIAIAGPKRMSAVPNIPTIIESGVPDFIHGTWQGLLAPASTPKDIIATLNAAVVKIINTPEIKDKLVAQGADVIGDTPEAFAAFLRDDTAKFAKVAKAAGIKPQ